MPPESQVGGSNPLVPWLCHCQRDPGRQAPHHSRAEIAQLGVRGSGSLALASPQVAVWHSARCLASLGPSLTKGLNFLLC